MASWFSRSLLLLASVVYVISLLSITLVLALKWRVINAATATSLNRYGHAKKSYLSIFCPLGKCSLFS